MCRAMRATPVSKAWLPRPSPKNLTRSPYDPTKRRVDMTYTSQFVLRPLHIRDMSRLPP